VCKDEGFGGLSASSEIRRSINQKHRNQLPTESAFIHGQSLWSSAKADKVYKFMNMMAKKTGVSGLFDLKGNVSTITGSS
jgi:hypothetical protein